MEYGVVSFTCTECEVPQPYKPGPICYVCAAWLGRIERKANPAFVIIEHRFYTLGSRDETVYVEHSTKVRLHNGRVVPFVDIHDHGMIPERFRDRLPNNAEFVS